MFLGLVAKYFESQLGKEIGGEWMKLNFCKVKNRVLIRRQVELLNGKTFCRVVKRPLLMAHTKNVYESNQPMLVRN